MIGTNSKLAILAGTILLLANFGSQQVNAQQLQVNSPDTEQEVTVEDPQPVVEQAELVPNTNNETELDEFRYNTKPGQSLTLLARRSIQLGAQNRGIELDEASLIAAETCLVQTIGARLLEIDESVIISNSQVDAALDSTQNLTDASKARWASYGPITTDISNEVKPVAAPSYVSSENLDKDTDEVAIDEPTDSEVEVVRDELATEADQAGWYWWFIGGAAVAAMWYILGGDEVISRRRRS